MMLFGIFVNRERKTIFDIASDLNTIINHSSESLRILCNFKTVCILEIIILKFNSF